MAISFWLFWQNVSAEINVRLAWSANLSYVPSWTIDYKIWSLLVSNNSEDYSIKWIVLRNSGLNDDTNIIIAVKQNWLFISDYFKLNYWTSRQDTKICFKNPILIGKWWATTLDIVASSKWTNDQFLLNFVSIDGWILNNWFYIGGFNTTSYNNVVADFSYTWTILNSCDTVFTTWIKEIPKSEAVNLKNEIIDTITKLESCKEKHGDNVTLNAQWNCICKTGGYELWDYNVCLSEKNPDTSSGITTVAYTYEKTAKEFKKSRFLTIDTTFKIWSQVKIYKVLKTRANWTRDVYIAKVKVRKNGKVIYRLSNYGKYKIVQ